MSKVAENLDLLMRLRGLGVLELAGRAGITPQTIANIMSGRTKMSGDTAIALAAVLGYPVEEFLSLLRSDLELKLVAKKPTGKRR